MYFEEVPEMVAILEELMKTVDIVEDMEAVISLCTFKLLIKFPIVLVSKKDRSRNLVSDILESWKILTDCL